VFQRIAAMLNKERKSVNGSKILLLGLAYKKGTSDFRESPSVHVARRLSAAGAEVAFADPYVARASSYELEFPLVEFGESELSRADLVAVLVDHIDFDPRTVASAAAMVFDGRNHLAGLDFNGEKL
jgi:UDP-N-acetyl-D-glucosamine dehydrogenase